jgi:pyrimidine operon attenuation protein/uracil phosphoribosyltransferase
VAAKVKAVVLDAGDVERALTRIAHEILERNKGTQNLVFLGIRSRGEILAERLVRKVKTIEGTDIPHGALDITFYRDDAGTHKPGKAPESTHLPFDVNNKNVVLIDDVLYTGRSARAAIDQIIDFGRPIAIRLAVLVDRGHREFPIHADYVGKNIPSSSKEEVLVHVKEKDGVDEVVIVEVES